MEEPDVVVSGAGAAGLFMTKTLSEHGLRVVLLEKAARVAPGPSTRNEGWIHSGSFHAAAIDDKERAIKVALRVRFGHDHVLHFAPEAIEDLDSRSFILIPESDVHMTVERWNSAGVYHRAVTYSHLDEKALNKNLAIDHKIFEVSDVSINSRILYAKLKTYATKLHLSSSIVGFETDASVAVVETPNGKLRFRPKIFVYALGPSTAQFFRTKFEFEIPQKLFVSHLVDMPKLCNHGYFRIGHREATLMHHQSHSIFGLSREQRNWEGLEPEDGTYPPSKEAVQQLKEASIEMIPRAAEYWKSGKAKVRACVKVTTELDNNQLPDLVAQFGEPVPNHVWMLAGKMTEAPFVAARVFNKVIWERLNLGAEVSPRPMDEREV